MLQVSESERGDENRGLEIWEKVYSFVQTYELVCRDWNVRGAGERERGKEGRGIDDVEGELQLVL